MSRTFFAYHLTHVFGRFGLESYYTNSTKPQEGDTVYVISGDDGPEGEGKEYWLEGIFRIYRKTRGPWALKGKSGEKRNYDYRLSMSPVRVPDQPIPLNYAPWYNRLEVRNYFASGQNFNPLPVDPDYKQRFDNLLSGFGQADALELADDLDEIQKTVVNPTNRDALVKARIGQGKFRTDVTEIWGLGEVCPLTGIDVPELLIASHIKPWRESDERERLDPANGLLVATHVDKLFDRHLLSFRFEKDEFFVEVHPRVRQVAKNLGIAKHDRLKTIYLSPSLTRKVATYLVSHYERFKQKICNDVPSAS